MGRNLPNPYLRGRINTVQYPVWTRIPRSIFSGKGVPGTVSSFSSSSVLHQLVHLLTFNMPPSSFPPSYVTAQKRLVKGNSCPDTSRRCCGYRFETHTCTELGDRGFVREGRIMQHRGSKARGMDGSGVANWIPRCSPGGHGITPDLN